jgi:hypothetical protein
MTPSDFAAFLILPIGGFALGVWAYWIATRDRRCRRSSLAHKP